MKPFVKFTGVVAPLERINVDTDQIIPKQFLKRIERTGFGKYLFYDWKNYLDGRPRPDFVLNMEPYSLAEILLTGSNFGCGSSREHAVWALQDFGFKTVIAPSFADIFYSNCLKNGLLPVALEEREVQNLFSISKGPTPLRITVDLGNQLLLIHPDEAKIRFEIDGYNKKILLEGLDDIALTLQHENYIDEFERKRVRYLDPVPSSL